MNVCDKCRNLLIGSQYPAEFTLKENFTLILGKPIFEKQKNTSFSWGGPGTSTQTLQTIL